jgi:hypothetical protein
MVVAVRLAGTLRLSRTETHARFVGEHGKDAITMNEAKLRNCPFCDGKASYTDNFYDNGTGHCVFCEDCGAGTAILTGATPPEELKELVYIDWNRRVDIRPTPASNSLIPVDDSLPDNDGEYLVYTDHYEIAEYDTELRQFGHTDEYKDELGYTITEWYEVHGVTHWMPMPKPPESDV